MIPRNVGSARMSRINSKVKKDGLEQENIDLKQKNSDLKQEIDNLKN